MFVIPLQSADYHQAPITSVRFSSDTSPEVMSVDLNGCGNCSAAVPVPFLTFACEYSPPHQPVEYSDVFQVYSMGRGLSHNFGRFKDRADCCCVQTHAVVVADRHVLCGFLLVVCGEHAYPGYDVLWLIG
jgi:hypothetical protein